MFHFMGIAVVLGASLATTGAGSQELKRCTVVANTEALDKPDGKRVVFEVAAHTGLVLLKQGGKQNKWCELWGGKLGSGWVLCDQTRTDNPDVSFVADGKLAAYDKPEGIKTDLVFEKGQGGFLLAYTGSWCHLGAAGAGEGWVPCARGHFDGVRPAAEPPKGPKERKR
jgi:hypothetical protein